MLSKCSSAESVTAPLARTSSIRAVIASPQDLHGLHALRVAPVAPGPRTRPAHPVWERKRTSLPAAQQETPDQEKLRQLGVESVHIKFTAFLDDLNVAMTVPRYQKMRS